MIKIRNGILLILLASVIFVAYRADAAISLEALKSNDIVAVRSSIESGEDVNAKYDKGNTALMIAAGRNLFEMTQMLLDHGADINAQGSSGGTALMAASSRNHIEIVRLLIARGADVNLRSKNGNTALMSVINLWPEQNGVAIAKELLEHGADVNYKNNSGLSPLLSAQLYPPGKENREMIKLLREHGAKMTWYDGLRILMVSGLFFSIVLFAKRIIIRKRTKSGER